MGGKTYQIAFQSEGYQGSGNWPGFDVVSEFDADSDREANGLAEEQYPGQEWYLLDARTGTNINA